MFVGYLAESLSKIRHGPDEERPFGFRQRKPLIPKDTVFNKDGLQLVHGKPIDTLDTEGNVLTICVWSYPLSTPINEEAANRKCSAIVFRSPSIFTDESSNRAPNIRRKNLCA
uniref:Uncharacterized protein n=1 Tax=Acrobeloides nanus TaxID=290746 RepID=A0A914C448_9BILA